MVSLATLLTIVVLLGVATLFARLAAEAGLPPAAAILIVGIAAGGMLPHDLTIELRPQMLAVFLPALIFEAAWDVDARALRRVLWTIVSLAFAGTLVSAFVIAAAALFGGLPVGSALVLGAILAATDPVAVLSLFRRIGIPSELFTIVGGESIANDGVAAVLVMTLVSLSFAGSPPDLLKAVVIRSVAMTVGGIAAGVFVALLAGGFLRALKLAWERIGVTLAVAYGAYALASAFGASGIFASAAAGVTLPAFALAKSDARAVEWFWDRLALAANAVVFLLMGLSLKLERIFGEPLLLAVVVLAVVLSRLVLAYLAPLPGRREALRGWREAIALAGVRGGLSLALALGLPLRFPSRPAIVDAVSAVVFLTVVVQGWLVAPALRRLPIGAPARTASGEGPNG